jgi:hypothetical protein
MLIGGIAVGYYGYPRATGDMDIWVNNSQQNAEAMSGLLQEFGLNLPDNFTETFCNERKVFRIGVPPLRIEVLNQISGVTFGACYARRNQVKANDLSVNIISLDDLKQNKRAAARTNDLDDLANLP